MSFKLRSEVIRFMIVWTPRSTSCLNFPFLYGTKYNTFVLSMTGEHFNQRMIDWRQYKISWLPLWLRWWRICLQCGRPKFEPWVRKILWKRAWLTTPVFLPGEFHGQRSLAGYSPWDHKEVDTTEQLTHTHTHTHTGSLCSIKKGRKISSSQNKWNGWNATSTCPHSPQNPYLWMSEVQCLLPSVFNAVSLQCGCGRGRKNICLTDIP